MVYLSSQEFDVKMRKAQERNASYERKRKLREERRKYWPKFILPSTSKIVLLVAALLCLETMIFCQYMILVTGDTNALYAMIGAILSFASVVLGYFAKSTKENSKDGIIFETAMANVQASNVPNVTEEAVG